MSFGKYVSHLLLRQFSFFPDRHRIGPECYEFVTLNGMEMSRYVSAKVAE